MYHLICNATLIQLPDQYWKFTFGILMGLTSFLATSGNAVFILIFYKYRNLLTSSNKILASMVIADFLTGLTVCPLYSAQLLNTKFANVCTINYIRRYCETAFICASLLSVAFISIDRSLRLIKLQNYRMSERTLYCILFVGWLSSLVLPSIGFVGPRFYFYSAFISCMLVLLLFIIILCYAIIILSLRRRRGNIGNKTNSIYIKNEKRAVKTILIILTIYTVTILPLLAKSILHCLHYFKEVEALRFC